MLDILLERLRYLKTSKDPKWAVDEKRTLQAEISLYQQEKEQELAQISEALTELDAMDVPDSFHGGPQ